MWLTAIAENVNKNLAKESRKGFPSRKLCHMSANIKRYISVARCVYIF